MVVVPAGDRRKGFGAFQPNQRHGPYYGPVSFFYARTGLRYGVDLDARSERLEPAELLARARFRDCLDVLNGDQSPKAILIRMRAMLLLGEHHAVVRLNLLEKIDSMPTGDAARARALLARAYFRSAMRAAASESLSAARTLAESCAEPAALAEVRYEEALQAWSTGDLDTAEQMISQIIGNREWRAKALDLRAWVAKRRNDHAAQIADSRAAFISVHGEDVWLKANILQSLSAIAREVFDIDAIAFVESHAENVAWTGETCNQEFYTFRNLAWCFALSGQFLQAGEYFGRAEVCIPSDEHRALIEVDRAYVAQWLGEEKTADRHLERACALADATDWKTSGEERSALLLLAQVIAPRNVEHAERYLRRYIGITQPLSPLLGSGSGDAWKHALEQYAAGTVYRYKGMRNEAIDAFALAYDIWSAIGYEWRAALAALDLGELTDSKHLDIAVDIIERKIPSSFLANAVSPYSRRTHHPDVLRLSPQRRAILECLMGGLGNEEIARRLQVGESLVKRQLSKIYKTFGVTNVRQLFAALRARRIL